MILNILSFNFVQTANKSLRFKRFRSYVNRSIVVPITVKIALLFLFDVRCLLFIVVMLFFLRLFVPNNSEFSKPVFIVARMLLTPRWVS